MYQRSEIGCLQQNARQGNQRNQRSNHRDHAKELFPEPDLITALKVAVVSKYVLEILDLIGRCFNHVRLERMEDALVMNHPQSAVVELSVVTTNIYFGDHILAVKEPARIHRTKRFRRQAHVPIFQFVAICAFIPESIADTHIGADIRENIITKREYIARDID